MTLPRLIASSAVAAIHAGALVGLISAGRLWQSQQYFQQDLTRLGWRAGRTALFDGFALGFGVVFVASVLLRIALGRGLDRVRVAQVMLVSVALAATLWFQDDVRRALWSTPFGDTSRATKSIAAGVLVALGCAFLFVILPRWMRKGAAQRRARPCGPSRSTVVSALVVVAGLVVVALHVNRLDRERPLGPNIVLVTIDTLRADHLSAYGYERSTSPSIDRLAARGVLFERALSQAPWTLPSMASVHTSLYPSEHGANSATRALDPSATMLAEVLSNAGYHTAGIVSHTFVDRGFGFAQGFDHFEAHVLGHDGVSSPRLNELASACATRLSEPFFLWVHYFDPHFSYLPHAEFEFGSPYSGSFPTEIRHEDLKVARDDVDDADIQHVVDTYDEEIAYTDARIGELLGGLDALPLERPLITVLTADHGEAFMERGRFGHGRDVYQELVHVPLVVSGPADLIPQGARVAGTVEIASIARTISRLAGIDSARFGGEDLLELSRGDASERSSYVEGSEAWRVSERSIAVVSRDGWKLVRHVESGAHELFHLPSDARELVDRWESDSNDDSKRAELFAALEAFALRMGDTRAGTELVLDESELQHLEDLGYVE